MAEGAGRIARAGRPPRTWAFSTGAWVGKHRQSQHIAAHDRAFPVPGIPPRIVPRTPDLSCCDRKSAVLRSPRPIAPVSYLGAVFSMSSRLSPPPSPSGTSTAWPSQCGAWSCVHAATRGILEHRFGDTLRPQRQLRRQLRRRTTQVVSPAGQRELDLQPGAPARQTPSRPPALGNTFLRVLRTRFSATHSGFGSTTDLHTAQSTR